MNIGEKPKTILEFFGNVNSGNGDVSIARMDSPEGWVEPGQTPDFDEYTVVLDGTLRVETEDTAFDVSAGQGVLAEKRRWVRYTSPYPGGAEYIAVCIPAFAPDTVHRDGTTDESPAHDR